MMHSAPFRSLAVCGVLSVVLLSSCEKAKDLVRNFGMNSPSRPPVAYSGSLVTDLNKSTYDRFPDQPGRVVLVDFHSQRCGSCKVLGPLLDKIARENNGLVLVGKVDVMANQDIAVKEGVSRLPDVRVYRDGKLIDKFLDAPGESELRERIKGYTKGLQAVPATPAAESGGQATPTPMSKDWLPPGMSRR